MERARKVVTGERGLGPLSASSAISNSGEFVIEVMTARARLRCSQMPTGLPDCMPGHPVLKAVHGNFQIIRPGSRSNFNLNDTLPDAITDPRQLEIAEENTTHLHHVPVGVRECSGQATTMRLDSEWIGKLVNNGRGPHFWARRHHSGGYKLHQRGRG